LQDAPDFLREGLETFRRNACALLRIAGRPVTAEALLDMVRGAPRAPDPARDEAWLRTSLCARCLARLDASRKEHAALAVYFLRDLPGLGAPAWRALEGAFFGVLAGAAFDAPEAAGQREGPSFAPHEVARERRTTP
jgi:hypothetical protein